MRMSEVRRARERIEDSWRMLQNQWQTSCGQWDDVVRQHFEQEFWQDCERVIPPALREMQKLTEILAQARREVK